MSAGILLAANAHYEPLGLAVVTACAVAGYGGTLALLLAAHEINRAMSLTAQRVLVRGHRGCCWRPSRCRSVFNGIAASGLLCARGIVGSKDGLFPQSAGR